MRFNDLKTCLKTAVLLTAVLLLGAGLAVAQQQVNLTAGPTTVTLADGSVVPMWGYSCGAAVTGSTATCASLNMPVGATTPPAGWSPVVITVPTGQSLQINLTNNLSFTAGTGTNTVPTSLAIVGQLGAGLGTTATSTPSPNHMYAQGCVTWPIADAPPGQPCNATTASNTLPPPTQGNRVQSFSTEVAALATTSLTWTTPRPGTYLLESGTHPSIQGPMGLYGMVVVTEAPSATAVAPASATTGCAYTPVAGTTCVVPYNAEADLLFSEIDPVQNNAVQAAVTTAGFSETMVWSGQPGGCGNPSSPTYHQCYPPAVNYRPLYYLINGVGFSKSNASASLFPVAPATGVTGTVLVRMVNAGLRMHVPSIVGSQTGTAVAPALPPAGFALIAEDGNPLPGIPRVQSEVFMAAGKTYDVMVNAPAATTTGGTLPVYDRELSLSGNAIARDAGMLAYISVNGGALPSSPSIAAAVARDDTYNSLIAGQTFTVSDPGKGLIANDTNVYGVQLVGTVAGLTLNANGTFTYTGGPRSFTYCANGTVTGTTCSSGITANVTLGAGDTSSTITCSSPSYTARTATYLAIATPGVLSGCKDASGYPLTVVTTTPVAPIAMTGGGTVLVDASGAFTASVGGAGTYSFSFTAKNSQGNTATATASLVFPAGSGLTVTLLDGADKTTQITDYRWVIEEDRTFYIDPNCTTNPQPASCTPFGTAGIVPTFGTNFHTSYMPLIAAGCTGTLSCEGGQKIFDPTTGTHVAAVCDVGNGVCRPDPAGNGFTAVNPSQVVLDPTKRYFISVLPGDAANPFANAYGGAPDCSPAGVAAGSCGHGMGGAPIAPGQLAVTVLSQPTPFPPAKLSVFVFEDDFPLNGEQDGGGGIDILSPNEPGLGGFEITLFDDAGGTGDATGQLTHDMFNQPLANSLAGTIDPLTLVDACPITAQPLVGMDTSNGNAPGSQGTIGITGRIVTCPTYEADGVTLSPLAGQAVVPNMMQGRYGVVATPAADRIARGEEWLQTNTLDGQKAHDSFLRIGEPSYFQEFGPAGYHVSIGFANPAIINSRKPGVCGGTDPNITGVNCSHTVTGVVTGERMSRTPDQRLYSSGDNSTFSFTQCYVSFGDPDGEDFAFTKCNADGTFTLTGLPDGNWRVTVFDQWNDMLVDGLSTPVGLGPGFTACPGPTTSTTTCDMGQIATSQWQANIYTSSFFDANGNGVRDANELGLTLVSTNIRFRDGSFSNFNNTDLSGNAGFNEIFPLFSWYVVESDNTRYKNTGTHVVYDAGGAADGTCTSVTAPCGNSTIGAGMANTAEVIPVPANLRVPGAYYCGNADCTDAPAPLAPGASTTGTSTGRVDPPWVLSEGWQGFSGQNSFLEFGKKPFVVGENGGIRGEVVYDSTRPFDDPQLNLHLSWTPNVPNVTVNLYQEGVAADGVTQTLKLVDTTKTSSWDDWAQGFRSDLVPNMNCPGQGRGTGTNADLFFFSLYNQPNYLDFYNSQHGGAAITALPNNSQFKCYDGMHNWNQLQPAPYDGAYRFPSVTGINPSTGMPTGTNCTVCVPNPDSNDPWRFRTPMLPAGKYVVEVVLPPGYELVKEEDKNILIGDNYIAPVTQQFGGLGAIYIIPDQASVGASYNANNAQNQTTDLGTLNLPRGEGDTGSVEQFWPCVGEARIVPDFMSIFPQAQEVAAFAGATRNLCDRREISLQDQASALAKFYVFSSTHVASHFTGVITDDYTSEFDPFSPQFGEKFSPPDLPVAIKDWAGNEISRVYADQWGTYDGLTYSTWEVNPPNPTGYGPNTMVTCMNDPGPIVDTRPGSPTLGQMITDPLFTYGYSQFCYEIPFMPGQTQYMDTPVVPTSAFAGAGYDNPDCNYPDLTPAIKEVDGDGIGPWVSVPGNNITITALGDQAVPNYGYTGPQATTAPFNLKTVNRHYGFGATAGTVTIGGAVATIVSWSDTQIVATVPGNVPQCAIQQQVQYGNPNTTGAPGQTTRCGELVVTAANGKQSIDTVTVTVRGKAPTHVAASASVQAAIDAAAPGDLIIVDPTCTTATGPVACTTTGATKSSSAHNEILLMWKPVRLQGVGAATSILNASTHPAGKMDVWRREVNCLFGLGLNGQPYTGNVTLDANGQPIPGSGGTNPFDPSGVAACPGTGWQYFVGVAGGNNPQIDRLPLEATLGWDANLNGNLAELLQEPSLMGALEGAGITVLSKGVYFPSNPFDPALLAGFPDGTILFRSSNTSTYCNGSYPSNFECNPSSIDGLGITDSSQGGGGIFVHGWGHNVQIANNRIYGNAGTLSGGINIGQGEFPGAYIQGSATNAAPGSCETSPTANAQLPYCHNMNVNIHNNAVMLNSSIGDELFSATPAGAGGVSFCTGSDYYKFNYNWVCGNLSSGDGGGIGHLGFSKNGDIEHNSIIFNQSTNPSIATNGGGIVITGTPDVDPACGVTTDQDCVPALGTVGPSDGIGPGLVINANLIQGNAAESGSGGGIAFQHLNGSEMVQFPTTPAQWYSVQFTNNIVTDNVAGWDGGGISLLDAFEVNIVNNTIVSNDTTASSGMLFNTLGAPLAGTQGPCPVPVDPTTGLCPIQVTTSTPQPAGLVSIQNSATLNANLPATVTCPPGHFAGASGTNGTCRHISYPALVNNLFWQNRAFFLSVGSLGTGTQNQQNVVTLNPTLNQTATGACMSGASYWDIGVRLDSGPSNHGSGFTLNPMYSVLTSTTGYSSTNTMSNPTVVSQYCNGSRVPPENGGLGYNVPAGIADATVPNPIFSLTPAATVDEGNNWVNMRWGPLSMTNPSVQGTDLNYGGGPALGNYALLTGSPAIDYVPTTETLPAGVTVPGTDFYGNRRPESNGARCFDVGAVENQTTAGNSCGAAAPPALTAISPASGVIGATISVTISGTNLTGATAITITRPGGGAVGVTHGTFSVNTAGTAITTTFIIARSAAVGARNVTVTTPGGVSNAVTFTVQAAAITFSGPSPSLLTGTTTPHTGIVTVSNGTGANVGPLNITSVGVVKVGATGGTFTIVAGSSTTCVAPLALAPGASCTINVQYAPTATTPPPTATAHISLGNSSGATVTPLLSPNFTAN